MRQASTYRGARRNSARDDLSKMERHEGKVGKGRLMKWLQRNPKLAPYYQEAVRLLNNGGTAPTWKAVRKMMVIVATGPKINDIVLGRIPFITTQGRYERGSWRAYPRVTIDANLTVTP